MSKNINVRIALKRDTSANWTNYNPVLLNGELILVDTSEGQLRAKIGDGIKTYTQLPFIDEALRALITEVDNNNSAVVVTKNGESRLLDTFNVVKLTQGEYEELEASNSLNPDALYLTEGEDTNLNPVYQNNAATLTNLTITDTTPSTSTNSGSLIVSGGAGFAGDIYANKVYGAVWNDYAEYREGPDFILPGEVVREKGDDTLILCDEDCAAGCYVVSDTFGFAIGQTKKANLPVAVSGRVLVYTAEDRMTYRDAIGRPVCGTKYGRIRLMTDEEAAQFPWKILGTVSSIPEYKFWGEKEVEVNERIWIKVK